ncbi:MAG TPA: organic hydroperoxide resistance protein [Solirubrobacteraceae bacterium]|nr:organic hydroperoxide resistance protein [Solirubrobacteraceae bacterium]
MKILYWAEAVSEGGRIGSARSTDGRLDVAIVVPAELGGPEDASGTNPEQLFAAGYAACFHSSMKTIAGMKKIDLTASTVTARVGLGPTGSGGFGLEAQLQVDLPGLDRETAHSLVRKAHRRCPYSNATRGNLDVALTVNGEPLEAAAA